MKTVLHLDASHIALKMTKKALNGFAHLISTATIAEALNALSANDIDCFLIDYFLLDGNGFEFAKAIRRNEKHHTTPIILITSSLSENLAYLAMKATINQCLSKPVEAEKIKNIISEQIAHPAIQKVERSKIKACCVRWETSNQVFEFSLDTGQLVYGTHLKETQERMRTALKAKIVENIERFEGTTNVQVVNYLLDID